MIRGADPKDAEAICGIYNPYTRDTTITFEESPVCVADMANRMAEVEKSSLPWLVEEANEVVIGYAFGSRWKPRSAYRYAVETTIYLAPAACGKGIGTRLYKELLQRLKANGMHVAIGGAALPNDASVRLHEKLGFRKVAEFMEVGYKLNKWINVGYWEVRL